MQYQKQTNIKNNNFFVLHIKMLNLSLKEWRLIAKNRNINSYKSMATDKLLEIINNKKDRKSLFK